MDTENLLKNKIKNNLLQTLLESLEDQKNCIKEKVKNTKHVECDFLMNSSENERAAFILIDNPSAPRYIKEVVSPEVYEYAQDLCIELRNELVQWYENECKMLIARLQRDLFVE